jgi:hypothetical protein
MPGLGFRGTDKHLTQSIRNDTNSIPNVEVFRQREAQAPVDPSLMARFDFVATTFSNAFNSEGEILIGKRKPPGCDRDCFEHWLSSGGFVQEVQNKRIFRHPLSEEQP